jgi:hypothetical protein
MSKERIFFKICGLGSSWAIENAMRTERSWDFDDLRICSQNFSTFCLELRSKKEQIRMNYVKNIDKKTDIITFRVNNVTYSWNSASSQNGNYNKIKFVWTGM